MQVDLQKREMGIAVGPLPTYGAPVRSALSGGGGARSGGGGTDSDTRAVQFNTPGGGNVFVL